MMHIQLKSSKDGRHKWDAIVEGKLVRFGAVGYEDFTMHHDEKRKQAYLRRHARENWTDAGIQTAGFWARWLLWNLLTIRESAQDIANRFNVSIEFL